MRRLRLPTYTIRNKKTGKEINKTMTISEMGEYENAHPEEEVMCGLPMVGYNFTRIHPSEDFRDRLREMKKKHPGNTINIK